MILRAFCRLAHALTAAIDMARGKRSDEKLVPAVFARRAAAYFRACDNGTASAACDSCDATFGDAKCGACRKKRRRPYTLSGLCLELGIPKREFAALRRDRAFAEAVEMALLKIEAYVEENSIAGQINGTLALAILRENFDWGEKTESAERLEVVMRGEADTLAK